MLVTRVLPPLLLSTTMLAAACGRPSPAPASYEAGSAARRYPLAGVVRGVDAESGQVTVAHDAVPDLMDGMTMSFAVKEGWVARVAAPGDRLTATLVLDGARSWLEGVALTKADAAVPASPGSSTASPSSATDAGIGPAAGTPLPTRGLRDQDGREVTAASYAGRLAVYSFIYTRCPLPDYCPLIMSRLNETAARLRALGRRDDVQFVVLTLDPAHDTPAVLRAYGQRRITGEGAAPFRRWALLTGEADAVKAWATFFALTYSADDDEIVHGLRTAAVDRTGRVRGVLRGNDWTVDQLLALLAAT